VPERFIWPVPQQSVRKPAAVQVERRLGNHRQSGARGEARRRYGRPSAAGDRKDRGKLVEMVFGTPGARAHRRAADRTGLLGSGASDDVAWRVLLTLGAVPAAVIYLRYRMPEPTRYQVQVQGRAEQAASRMSGFVGGKVSGYGSGAARHEMRLRAF
jgi:hypothetical protein